MSSRYDPADSEPPPLPGRAPLEPVPVSKRGTWAAVIAILLATAVSVGAAFGFDVCAFAHSIGISLDACKAPAPPAAEPATP